MGFVSEKKCWRCWSSMVCCKIVYMYMVVMEWSFSCSGVVMPDDVWRWFKWFLVEMEKEIDLCSGCLKRVVSRV